MYSNQTNYSGVTTVTLVTNVTVVFIGTEKLSIFNDSWLWTKNFCVVCWAFNSFQTTTKTQDLKWILVYAKTFRKISTAYPTSMRGKCRGNPRKKVYLKGYFQVVFPTKTPQSHKKQKRWNPLLIKFLARFYSGTNLKVYLLYNVFFSRSEYNDWYLVEWFFHVIGIHPNFGCQGILDCYRRHSLHHCFRNFGFLHQNC